MTPPGLIITGASGFVGRHLLAVLKENYRIFALARRSQRECGAPFHPNIAWMQVDIRDRDVVAATFREIASAGGAQFLVHLAAFYDFTGQNRAEYRLTNVDGTRHVLEAAVPLGLKRLFFASSVAACSFPRPEGEVREDTPPDADHPYGRSKRLGEELIRAYRHAPTCIVRLGAVYSDCCEYAPLYVLLETWLKSRWRSRVLVGRGLAAIPYVHVLEVTAFFRHLLAEECRLGSGEVVIASAAGCTSQKEIYDRAVRLYFGRNRTALHMPIPVCRLGLALMDLFGRIRKRRPFERAWMLHYADRVLSVDNSQTSHRLGWSPSPRYRIARRLPFMVERLKSEPFEWYAKNAAAMRRTTDRPDLRIYAEMVAVEDQVVSLAAESALAEAGRRELRGIGAMHRADLEWVIRLLYRLLMSSVQSSNRMLLMNYIEVTAASRFRAGMSADEMGLLLERLQASTLSILDAGSARKVTRQELHDRISIPIEFGFEEIRAQNERYQQGLVSLPSGESAAREPTPREKLEETIWSCLVQRR
jgi:nucleoside-diphosphate-sugar epimerase